MKATLYQADWGGYGTHVGLTFWAVPPRTAKEKREWKKLFDKNYEVVISFRKKGTKA